MRVFSFPTEVDQVLDGLGDKQAEFVKEAVLEKAQREGLLKRSEYSPDSEPQPQPIGARLNQRQRTFLDGPAHLSERNVRKAIAHDTVDERHQARQ
jgi:hypothetical protein